MIKASHASSNNHNDCFQFQFCKFILSRSSMSSCAASTKVVLCRKAKNVSNFFKVDSLFGPDVRLLYKTYATLYFVFIFDQSENELAMLDLMQGFVETLDKCLNNVCELDVVFNFNKVHTILDEIILGGQVLETNISEVIKAVQEISRM